LNVGRRGAVWVGSVEIIDGICGVLKVFCGFPGTSVGAIPDPFDEVFQLSSLNLGVQNFLYLVFFFSFNLYRRRWILRTAWKAILLIWF
jgi:hypothetical protein